MKLSGGLVPSETAGHADRLMFSPYKPTGRMIGRKKANAAIPTSTRKFVRNRRILIILLERVRDKNSARAPAHLVAPGGQENGGVDSVEESSKDLRDHAFP